jgi:hypothetical protein
MHGRPLAELLQALPPAVRARRELQPLAGANGGDGEARRLYRATLARNVVALARVAELLDAAAADGVELLPIKGALFADALWGDPGLRPMADVDLLVRPAQLDAAVRALEACGLARAYPAGRARFTTRHGHDVALVDGDFHLDLHYKLFHELGIDAAVEPVFARAIPLRALGGERRVPSWDDHLFITLAHAATHAFDSPLWVLDVALLVERTGGIAVAAAEARRRRATRAFDAALRLAHRALPADVPAPDAPPTARNRLLDAVLGPEPLARPPSQRRSLAARALVTDDPRDAAREIARKLELRAVELAERLAGRRR